jgi:hypothetical protein
MDLSPVPMATTSTTNLSSSMAATMQDPQSATFCLAPTCRYSFGPPFGMEQSRKA